jgi:hypothetical protein
MLFVEMESPNSPHAAEYYASIWIKLFSGLPWVLMGGLGVFGVSLMVPGVLQPGNYSPDFAAAVLAESP